MKQRHIIGLVLLAALVIGALGATTGAGGQTVGYVHVDRLTREYSSVVAVEKLFEAEINKLQNEFDTVSKGMDDAAKEILFAEYERKLQQRYMELNLDGRYQNALQEIEIAIGKVAQKQGVSIVIDASAVFYGGVDLTEEVLAEGRK